MWRRDLQEKRPLRPIIPVVLYHGKRPWRLPDNFAGQFSLPQAFDPFIPNYRWLFVDLSRWDTPATAPPGIRSNIFLVTALFLMKHAYNMDLEKAGRILALWRELEYIGNEDSLILELYYVSFTTDVSFQELQQAIVQIGLNTEELMPTLGERMQAEGKTEGKCESLIRLLDLKYGLTSDERDMIRRTNDQGKLDQAIDLVITADNKDAVLQALE